MFLAALSFCLHRCNVDPLPLLRRARRHLARRHLARRHPARRHPAHREVWIANRVDAVNTC
jgi:hypothetical protein